MKTSTILSSYAVAGAALVSAAPLISSCTSAASLPALDLSALARVNLPLATLATNTINDLDQLIPQFGVRQGAQADRVQIGSCDGFSPSANQPVLIQCSCPPDRAAFLDLVGRAISNGTFFGEATAAFSLDVSDQSDETNKIRANVATVVLQSFNLEKGVGCPAASAPNIFIMQTSGTKSNQVFIV